MLKNLFRKEEKALIYYKNTKNAGYLEGNVILNKPKKFNWDSWINDFVRGMEFQHGLKTGDIVITMFQKL